MTSYEVNVRGKTYRIELEPTTQSMPERANPSNARPGETHWTIRLEGREILVSCQRVTSDSLSLIIHGKSYEVRRENEGETLNLALHGRTYACSIRDPRSLRSRRHTSIAEGGAQKITASMPGKIVRVLAQAGELISAGQGILVIEAMKMQNEVRSPKTGVLKHLAVREGANVNAGEMLAIIE